MRYEDLVLKPLETARGMLEYLELDASDDAGEAAARGRLRGLRPSCASTAPPQAAEESIGRWRREGDERFRELCNEVFGDILGDFGYSEVGYVG